MIPAKERAHALVIECIPLLTSFNKHSARALEEHIVSALLDAVAEAERLERERCATIAETMGLELLEEDAGMNPREMGYEIGERIRGYRAARL